VLASFYTFAVSAHRLRGVWRLDVFQYAPCFLMGVTAYWALRRQKTRRPLLPAWSWSFVVLGNVALWFLTWDAPWPVWIGRALFAASLGVAIPFVRDAASSMFTRVAHTVATYSYGVYLLHLLAIRAGFWLLRNQPPVVQCTTVIIVLVGSCYVSYHLIEKPGIALGQFLVRGRRSAIALEVTQVASVP
jgi:peptidoglycan/LPS O-acetylase OafA/YrhL